MILIIRLASGVSSSSAVRLVAGCCWYHSPNAASTSGSSVFAVQTRESVKIMKKTSKKRSTSSEAGARVSARNVRASRDELRPHYDFDYAKAKPNRFASRFKQDTVAVILEPDVANVFRSSDAVNSFLRSAISAMPRTLPEKKKRAS